MDIALLQFVIITLLTAALLFRSKAWRLIRIRDSVHLTLLGILYFLSLVTYAISVILPHADESFTPQGLARYLGLICLPFVMLFLFSFFDTWEKKYSTTPRAERLVGGLLFLMIFLAYFARDTRFNAALVGTSGAILKVAFACFVALANIPLMFLIVDALGQLFTDVWRKHFFGIAEIQGRVQNNVMLAFLILGYGCLIAAMV